MAITQAQYDEYAATATADYAARKGAKEVTFADQTTVFESWAEIWKWLQWLKGQVSDAPGASRTRYAATSKGV